jgi:hypothetical protein
LGNLSLKRISTASTLMIDESVGDLWSDTSGHL